MSRAETTAMLSKLVEKRLKNRVSYGLARLTSTLEHHGTGASTTSDSSLSRPATCSNQAVWN